MRLGGCSPATLEQRIAALVAGLTALTQLTHLTAPALPSYLPASGPPSLRSMALTGAAWWEAPAGHAPGLGPWLASLTQLTELSAEVGAAALPLPPYPQMRVLGCAVHEPSCFA